MIFITDIIYSHAGTFSFQSLFYNFGVGSSSLDTTYLYLVWVFYIDTTVNELIGIRNYEAGRYINIGISVWLDHGYAKLAQRNLGLQTYPINGSCVTTINQIRSSSKAIQTPIFNFANWVLLFSMTFLGEIH